MGEEQRAAQRIDLPEPVPAKIGDVEAKILDVSLVGCRIEHAERLAIGAVMPLRFAWRGEQVQITAKVARTELRSVSGRMTYSTGLQFATSVDTSPDAVRRIMTSLVKTSVSERPPAELPVFFERAPFFRDDTPDEKPARPAARTPPPPPPAPAPAPAAVPAVAMAMGDGEIDVGGPSFELDLNPAAATTHFDFHDEPAVASRSFELEGEEPPVVQVVQIEEHDVPDSQSFELEAERHERYVRCTYEGSKWTVEQTHEAKQPREGFTIVDPGDQREIDQFCKTYQYADPDTRRMIRVSCELMIARGGRS